MQRGCLKTDALIDAFAEISRAEFVPEKFRNIHKADISVPLGFGQIMPAPSIIATMLELLEPAKGQTILVAGFGTGWVSTLLCHIVGASGQIISCDKSIAMEKIARVNIQNYSFVMQGQNMELFTVNSCSDLGEKWKFDRIIVLNPIFSQCQLEKHLKVGGRLVAPQDNIVCSYMRKSSQEIECQKHPDLQFLPT